VPPCLSIRLSSRLSCHHRVALPSTTASTPATGRLVRRARPRRWVQVSTHS
jgi:hypothetical protein